MDWPDGKPLTEDQRRQPIVWSVRVAMFDPPDVLPEQVDVWDAGNAPRLSTWGHLTEPQRLAVHWLAHRGGTPLHTDPAYPRFTHQLTLLNGGWMTTGIDGEVTPENVPGTLVCLDTHSPHQVVPDPRWEGERTWKLALAVDRHEPLSMAEAWRILRVFQSREVPPR